MLFCAFPCVVSVPCDSLGRKRPPCTHSSVHVSGRVASPVHVHIPPFMGQTIGDTLKCVRVPTVLVRYDGPCMPMTVNSFLCIVRYCFVTSSGACLRLSLTVCVCVWLFLRMVRYCMVAFNDASTNVPLNAHGCVRFGSCTGVGVACLRSVSHVHGYKKKCVFVGVLVSLCMSCRFFSMFECVHVCGCGCGFCLCTTFCHAYVFVR